MIDEDVPVYWAFKNCLVFSITRLLSVCGLAASINAASGIVTVLLSESSEAVFTSQR